MHSFDPQSAPTPHDGPTSDLVRCEECGWQGTTLFQQRLLAELRKPSQRGCPVCPNDTLSMRIAEPDLADGLSGSIALGLALSLGLALAGLALSILLGLGVL